MQRAHSINRNNPVSEMAIVNTFTKLIFGEEDYTAGDLLIIQAFRSADVGVSRDSHREMGEYLRSLGVREMIQLVSRLVQHMQGELENPASSSERGAPAPSAGQPNR